MDERQSLRSDVNEVTIDALSAADRALLAAARAARDHAYVPYTQPRVGAAVRAASGKIYSAGNLETVTLRQSVHGERNAVNVMVANGERLAGRPGVFVQQREGSRWRALIDLERTPIETLRGLGATPIADAPVTLEELFVAVGKA
jgi:hypothetical protein